MVAAEGRITLPDGRDLGFLVIGQGRPVLYFHGTASSRLEALLLKNFAHDAQLQIISLDRPGTGLSTFTPRKSLRSFANDANYLVDQFGINRLSLVGWSGGGPYVLTYAALFPNKVDVAVTIGSPSLPFDVATAHNNSLARFAMKIPSLGMLAMKRVQAQVQKISNNPSFFLKSDEGKRFLDNWPEKDAKFFADEHWLAVMYRSMAEAFRQGNKGIKALIQEHQLFIKPWAEPIELIPPGRVHIWHGTEDNTCRVENAHKLANTVPGPNLEIFPGEGHCVMFNHLKKLGNILNF